MVEKNAKDPQILQKIVIFKSAQVISHTTIKILRKSQYNL